MKNNIRYFDNPETLEDLKKQYRELAFKHHPDRGREQRGNESRQQRV
jgi:DnaJ-class molecular chaperone